MAEKSGEKAVKEADEIAKNLKKSNISDEVIEAAAKDSGKEGLEKLSKAAEKVGAENADKLAKEGYNLDNVIKLSDKGINPEKYAEYGIKNAKDAERAAKYLDRGKNLDEVKELMNGKVYMTGKDGEKELANMFGGKSQVYMSTSMGGRYIDQFANGIAHESKVGYTTLSERIKKQILKNAELIESKAINGAHWHFFKSGVTGDGGASQPLLDFLIEHGIQYTIH